MSFLTLLINVPLLNKVKNVMIQTFQSFMLLMLLLLTIKGSSPKNHHLLTLKLF